MLSARLGLPQLSTNADMISSSEVELMWTQWQMAAQEGEAAMSQQCRPVKQTANKKY